MQHPDGPHDGYYVTSKVIVVVLELLVLLAIIRLLAGWG